MVVKPTVSDCTTITLEKGFFEANISVIKNDNFPFKVKRIFYLYDIAAGGSRGSHAHKRCHQFLIALNGSFEVLLDDGFRKRRVFLNHPSSGLHIPPGIWASEVNFSSSSICLVMASMRYHEEDYIRDYSEYVELMEGYGK
jgi:hypothetical protein